MLFGALFIDDKFHVEIQADILNGEQRYFPVLVKTSTGEIVSSLEPLFLVRGRDYLAIPLIEHYMNMCKVDGCTDYQLNLFQPLLDRFREFKNKYPEMMKQPGVTKGKPYEPRNVETLTEKEKLIKDLLEKIDDGSLYIDYIREALGLL